MQVGVHLPTVGPSARAEVLIPFAQLVERLGYDSLWVIDHVVMASEQRSPYPYSTDGSLPFSRLDDLLEPISVLTYVAAVTSRIKLGTAVLILPMRPPVLLAKMIATLDHLSNGRYIFGVGTGWWKEEFEVLGVPFKERGKRLDEQIALMTRLWSGEPVDFSGSFYDVPGWVCRPRTRQQPHPPIWIGGVTRPAMRRAARLGDAWHARPMPADELRAGIQFVRKLAAEAERDPARIELTLRSDVVLRNDNLASCAQRLRDAAETGVSHVTVRLDPAYVSKSEEILSAFADRYLGDLQQIEAR